MASLLKKEEYDKLCNASKHFLQDNPFGIPQIETIMEAVFGDYTQRISSAEAQSWATYWTSLVNYEQLLQEPDGFAPPKLPLVSVMYFDLLDGILINVK